jgi:DNA polymerase III subunit chi
MAENADTSGSAASSGDGSSPLAASDASAGSRPAAGEGLAAGNGWQGRVDFYILEDPSSSARLKLACKLAEKAYLASQRVLVWHTEPEELKLFDELLWTFNDGSFVPHEVLMSSGTLGEAPVALSLGVAPSANVDIIINLAPDLPKCLSQTPRVAEIIDGDDGRRRAGRARFKAYRELGVQPASHNIRGD